MRGSIRKKHRIQRALSHGPLPRLNMPDPLRHSDSGIARSAGQTLLLTIGAVIMHGVALGGIMGAATIAQKLGIKDDKKEHIEVAVVNTPKKVEKPVEAPKEEKPPEPPKEEPKKVKKKPPPVADPIDKPPEPPKEPPKEENKPIVGLDENSMVKDGEGPSFGAGNTRMGETDKIAHDPNSIGEMQKTNEPPPKPVEVYNPPKRVKQVKPEYPTRYEQMGIEGDVKVRVKIDEDGHPIDVEILEPSPHAEFNFAAKKAALRESFAPAVKNGAKVVSYIVYIIHFRLEG